MTRFITAGAIALACLVLFCLNVVAQPLGARPDASPCELTNEGRKICRGGVVRSASPARTLKGYRAASVSRTCLTADTRAVLDRAEARFGVTFTLVSTCRPGARIAGTGHVSEHARGRAVDLLVPRGVSKAAVVRWLYANASGVTMTYAKMKHVHFDTGPYHKLACGGCGKPRRTKLAHVP